jgi:hypothetical protein
MALLKIGAAEEARQWFESAVSDGDDDSEGILINAYYSGLGAMPYLNGSPDAVRDWKINQPRAAQLSVDRANRVLQNPKARDEDKCQAVGTLIEVSMGWGKLNQRDPNKALEWSEKQLAMPGCKSKGEDNRLRAIMQGAGTYTQAERERLWRTRPLPTIVNPVPTITH